VTVGLFDIPTNSVEQRRSCVLRNCLADQEFPLLLWNSSVHKAYRVSTSSHWSVCRFRRSTPYHTIPHFFTTYIHYI
jgi:hypothetical protein